MMENFILFCSSWGLELTRKNFKTYSNAKPKKKPRRWRGNSIFSEILVSFLHPSFLSLTLMETTCMFQQQPEPGERPNTPRPHSRPLRRIGTQSSRAKITRLELNWSGTQTQERRAQVCVCRPEYSSLALFSYVFYLTVFGAHQKLSRVRYHVPQEVLYGAHQIV